MPVFVLHQPIETTDPFIKVENQLTPGVHHFSLVVEDERGRRSAQSVKAVIVVNTPPPSHPTQLTQPVQPTQASHPAQPPHPAQPAHPTRPSHPPHN
jgi:hypothetical protein